MLGMTGESLEGVVPRGGWQVAVRCCRWRGDRTAIHDSTSVAEFRAGRISRSFSRCFCPEVVLRGVSRIQDLVLSFHLVSLGTGT